MTMGFQFPGLDSAVNTKEKEVCEWRKPPLGKRLRSNLVAIAGAGGFGLPLLVTQDCFAREFDFVAVLADALNEDLLPFFQFVTHVFDAAIGNLGNVQQTVGSRKDF